MKLLLKMIYSTESAKSALKLCNKKGLMIVNKKYGMALDDEMIDAGGVRLNLGKYGTSFTLNIGKSFHSTWGLTKFVRRTANIYSDTGSLTHWDAFNPDLSESDNEGLSDLAFFFYEYNPYKNEKSAWLKPIAELSNKIVSLGGKTTKILDDADVLITQGWYHDPNLTLRDDVITIHQEQFLKLLPKEPKRTHKPSPRLIGESAYAWGLLSSKDYGAIQKGIDFAASHPQIIDVILDGCSLTKEGMIDRNKRFSGSGPALSYLDIALYGLLSSSPDNTKSADLRKSVKSISITSSSLPRLTGFTSLEDLRIAFLRGAAVTSKDLRSFGILPRLIRLDISAETYRPNIINSLDGLNAPKLNILNLSNIGLKNINTLLSCKYLRVVDLSNNDQITDISPLSTSKDHIEELSLNYCPLISDLSPLNGSTNLKSISLNGCMGIGEIAALNGSHNLQFFEMDNVNLKSIHGIEDMLLREVEITFTAKIKKPIKFKDLLIQNYNGSCSSIEISYLSIIPKPD